MAFAGQSAATTARPTLAADSTIKSASPAVAQFVVLTRPVKISIVYGETVLPAGLRLAVVSTDSSTVRVQYLNDVQALPVSAVRFESGPTLVAAPTASPAIKTIAPPPSVPPPISVSLRPGWDTQMQGGSTTMRELQGLLSPHAQAGIELGEAGIPIYAGVRYLMEAKEAANALGLGGTIPSRIKVATPGFPRDTLDYIIYDGTFEGGFNHLELVTDAAGRVVCLEFVNQHVRRVGNDPPGGWDTYNFVNTRLRASPTTRAHDASHRRGDVIQIETRFFQKEPRRGWDQREETKLLVPVPFARLILHCIQPGMANR